ncbi:hypothetical protein ACFQE1_01975 [Halobium palmae]|uniref:Uncharacterized protein n=1 Tax=Halobium palmae TaxID=1776492 RepID=A0ABD5RW65_9EURY
MNESQKVMHVLLSRERWWTAPEVAAEYGQNPGTVRANLSEFYNKLGILEEDKPGVYRIRYDRYEEAWAYVHYGWDAFEHPSLKPNAQEALADRANEQARRKIEASEGVEEVREMLAAKDT